MRTVLMRGGELVEMRVFGALVSWYTEHGGIKFACGCFREPHGQGAVGRYCKRHRFLDAFTR